MSKRIKIFSAAILAISIIGISLNAQACSPARLTPQEIVDHADKIIVARAISSKWSTEAKPHVFNYVRSIFDRFRPYDGTKRQGETVFKVNRSLTGTHTDYITIKHDASGAACGTTFNSYENYLIFVTEYKNKYFTSVFGVRPFLSEDDYKELTKIIGLQEEDHVRSYQGYLAPEDAY